MHWRGLTDRETLGAWDLCDDDGKPCDITAKIVKVVGGEVKSAEKPKGERRPFVYFEGQKKPLVCGATNAKTIASIAGSNHVEKWVGLLVTLYPTTTKAKGAEVVDCIRIRPRAAIGPATTIKDRPVNEDMRARQKAAMDRPDEREPGADDV